MKVSRDAANAALLNAEAIISAERAWILVAVDVTGDSPRKAHIYVRGKNWGRTPAEVSRSSVFYFPHVWDGELPEEPPYHKTELKYPKHNVPGESFAVGDGPFLLGTEMTDEMWDTMNNKNERLFFVGHIVYKDLISRTDHETRFCFCLSSQPGVGLVMTGPRHYNRHT